MSTEDDRESEAVSAKAKKTKKSKKVQRSKKAVRKKAAAANGPGSGGAAKFPRHSIERALRIPRAIIEQNAGKESSEAEAAAYVGVGLGGPFRVEISSAIKYGLLSRPRAGYVDITERARQAVRPQKPGDDIESLRQGVLEAPEISEVYKHYRGEDLPDGAFFTNALVDKFKIPSDKVAEFISIFMSSLESAHLIEKRGDKSRILDITSSEDLEPEAAPRRTAGATPKIAAGDSCFVVMPFAGAIGGYFHHVYEPAIKKAGLVAVRADADIFGTGKIIDQIWSGINAAKVLVAELTTKNPNVFYELGLAHALNKPVVLVSSNEEDVPFDLRHIRVIYYDVSDPFWGQKLIEKVAENIVSALKNPEEAVFKRALESK
ncbi:nucleoside 2-deoxyribosyltransferase [Bradyrhizobium sp. CCGB20]|uniref:nucleoside 2-deoxyribosyltransferase n=1 Tax=Bradyrhizobium sp. CCGB20 TaxID=2949633 RepID=UPI0020B225C3|nr:nucleoside 2-deoxyribosyltransferase [Bradyrhizobium sp. CCGB20]MCP3402723.1 nucleoside 2-deoxyribosyltransferase [Bradyrhizobium sp. CCGB20]